jgi:signal transduction histidine kinase
MKRRVEDLGGALTMTAGTNGGARLGVRLPLKKYSN